MLGIRGEEEEQPARRSARRSQSRAASERIPREAHRAE